MLTVLRTGPLEPKHSYGFAAKRVGSRSAIWSLSRHYHYDAASQQRSLFETFGFLEDMYKSTGAPGTLFARRPALSLEDRREMAQEGGRSVVGCTKRMNAPLDMRIQTRRIGKFCIHLFHRSTVNYIYHEDSNVQGKARRSLKTHFTPTNKGTRLYVSEHQASIMSRRSNNVRGPTSALTEFLRVCLRANSRKLSPDRVTIGIRHYGHVHREESSNRSTRA